MNTLESKTGLTVKHHQLLERIIPGSTSAIAPKLAGHDEQISIERLLELIEQQPQTEYRVSRTVGRERILTVHENTNEK